MTPLAAHADTLNHLERAISERDHWRLLARAALDQLALVATAPERAEAIHRDLRKDREAYMEATFRRQIGRTPADAPGEIEP